MKNLKLLHCDVGRIPISEIDKSCRFLAIDTLTPMTYLLCGDILIGFDQDKNLKLNVDLVSENVIADGSEIVIGMEFLADLQQICFSISNGNIVTFDPLTSQVDTVGCIPSFLAASSWSPDFEILVLVTNSGSVFFVNRDFEVVNEFALHPSEFGTDDLITVGWGKKETQFHGSEGKQAAATKAVLEASRVLDWDDKNVRISWRGDGQYFCISAVDSARGRTIRVWSREGVHCSTNEIVDGIGQCLAWKPSGSLIATSQNKSDVCQVIFYERNGLRHGEFSLPFQAANCRVKEFAWNRDSTILAVWLHSLEEDRIYLQLYTTSNYHWFCKLSYDFATDDGPSAWCWNPDQANTLHVALRNGRFNSYIFAFAVHRELLNDQRALVAVIDGRNLNLTDFRRAVVPPPMCQKTIAASSFVNEFSFMNDNEASIACLTHERELVIFKKSQEKNGLKNGTLIQDTASISLRLSKEKDEIIYHLQHLKDELFVHVSLSGDRWTLVVSEISKSGDQMDVRKTIAMDKGVFQLVPLKDLATGYLAILESADGAFWFLTDSYEIVPCTLFAKPLSSVASQVETVNVGGKLYVVCLNERFQLTINGTEISNDVGSFCLHDSFLLCTTITHHLKCIPYENFQQGISSKILSGCDERNVERGSKIVSAVSGDGKVVLQMPRGNLETIYPRALILSIVKKMLDGFQYKDALLLMRRHRVNLNLLYDHSPEHFLKNIDDFVNQINDSTNLNLFISDLKNEDVTESMYSQFYSRSGNVWSDLPTKKDKINFVCIHLRDALRKSIPSHEFCTSILMTLVKMTPPQLDSALQVVKDFRDNGVDTKIIDEALQHLLYVIDPNRLFDVALGTYDFDLVLMVAEKSQKDPKEFLPFLSELRSLEPSYMKYKIDVHLSRFGKALEHLLECAKADDSRFDEFVKFVKDHELYVQALRLSASDTSQYKVISVAFADHLLARRRYEEAAISYQVAGETTKAVDAYVKALNWTMALALARKSGVGEAEIRGLCEGLAQKLKDQRNFKDAALLECEVLKDIKKCVCTLLDGAYWEEAVFRIYQSGQSDLIESVLLPGIASAFQKTTEIIEKQRATFVQYKNRLAVVREKKKLRLAEINEKGEIDDPMTEVSTEASSTVTKSSAAYSSRSASSRARRVKKQEKKKYSLKEGNAYEDLGLLKELSEIVDQANKMQGDVANLLRTMAQFEMQIEGQRLQKAFGVFLELLRTSMPTIWPESIDLSMLPGPIEDQLDENSTAGDAANRFCGVLDARLKIKLGELEVVLCSNLNLAPFLEWTNECSVRALHFFGSINCGHLAWACTIEANQHLMPPRINFDTPWTLSLFS